MRFKLEQQGSLQFGGISKWYGQVSALMDVSLELGPGVIGLVGHNGAGKSTLLKLAAGLLRPSQGQVLLCGMDPSRPGSRRPMGISPDLERLPRALTGAQFVAGLLRLSGLDRRAARERAVECLVTLGLQEAMDRRIGTYSKGMCQRVRLAQALGHEPAVLLLDEPMSGLDPVVRREMAELFQRLAAAGALVLVSSHVLHELENLVEQVVFIHQGRLLAEGTVAELREQMDARPHHLLLGSPAPRELAVTLSDWPQVRGMHFLENAIEVEVAGGGIYEELTALACQRPGLIHEIRPLDDNLAAVFGYLVKG